MGAGLVEKCEDANLRVGARSTLWYLWQVT
jgi:hypothetical protein